MCFPFLFQGTVLFTIMMHAIVSLHSFITQHHAKHSFETTFASFEIFLLAEISSNT